MKGFATFFTSRGKKEKDASVQLSAPASPSHNNNKVPAIKLNDAFLQPPQRDVQRSPSPAPTVMAGSTLSSAFSRLHRPSLASLRKHMSSDAQTTLSTSTSSPSPSSRHHPHSPSSSSTSSHSHSHLQPSHHPHSSNSSSRLALSRSFFRSVSDVSKSAFAYSSSSSSASTSTHSTETCSSAMSSTSTVHLAVERRPSDGSLINDGLAVNENGKARHEALPRAPSPSQLDPHPRPHPHAHGNSSSRANPRASSPLLAPPPLPLPQLPHSEHARGSNDGHPTSLSVNVNSNFDTYDPFAAHYAPPTQPNSRKRLSPPTTSAVVPAPTTTNVVDRESPTRLLPPLPKIVGNVKQVSRPRALSLGSAAHGQPPPCPAHVLGPLPPLPPFATKQQQQPLVGVTPKAAGLAHGRKASNVDNHHHLPQGTGNASPPASAPPNAITFRERRGSVASGRSASSAGGVRRRPSTGDGKSSSSSASLHGKRPMTSPRPASSERLWASTNGTHHHHASQIGLFFDAIGSTSPRPAPGKRVPQLDQTWAQFLSETQSDFGKLVASPSTSSSVTSGGASTITAGTGSASASSLRSSSTMRVGASVPQPPRGPPPNRPLPPAPAPVQPLNIRRRPRAQTVGTTSPIIPVEPTTTASLAAFTATVSQPVVGLGMGVLPISPPATASSRLDFDSILDVVVTPAAESVDVYGGMLVDDDSKTASRPTTPATISSLPYLRGSESTNMLSLHAGARHSRGSSLSGSEWDGCSRTVSEMSLSLFPAPPARSIPATEPPVAASSSLLPPPSSLTSVLELPTPPVTPTNPRFVPNAPGPYSTSVASRSTSTIRPSKLEEEGDRDSCVLPLEDQSRLDYNTPATRPPSEATAPSVRYSADSSCSEPGFPSSATTVSSHETSVEDSVCRTSLDTDQTSEMMHIVDSPPRSSRSSVQQQQKRKAGAGSSVSKSNTLWCPPSPPQADRHSTQGKDKFNLLPNFYFDATFTASHHAPPNPPSALPGQPPSTPIKHRKSGVARREQLLNLLSANESAAQLRSPGSPWGGRVEWGEAL